MKQPKGKFVALTAGMVCLAAVLAAGYVLRFRILEWWLSGDLRSPDPAFREAATERLAALAPVRAIPYMVENYDRSRELLVDPFGDASPLKRMEERKARFRDHVARCGRAAAGTLLRIVAGKDSGTASVLLEILAGWDRSKEFPISDAELVDAIALALDRDAESIARHELGLLVCIYPDGKDTLPPLLEALRPRRGLRVLTAEVFRRLEADPRPLVSLLAGDLSREEGGEGPVTTEALDALGSFGPAAVEAAPAILPLLGNGSQAVRFRAIHALSAIGAPTVPALAGALGDPAVDVRRAAASILVDFGKDAAPAEGALRAALSDPDPDVRRDAAIALEKIGAAARP